MMQQMMESPMMQNFLSNPDALQSVLTSNPQMQQLMEVISNYGRVHFQYVVVTHPYCVLFMGMYIVLIVNVPI